MFGPAFLAVFAVLCAAFAGAALLACARRATAAPATAAIAAVGTVAALAYLATGAAPASLELPFGPPGLALLCALDGISGVFILIVCLAATAAAASSIGDDHGAATAAFLPAFVGGMLATLLAADSVTLLAGFEAMSFMSLALVLTQHKDPATRDAGLLYAGMAAFGALCLIAALGLLGHHAGPRFAAIRLNSPEGWRAGLVLALAVIGAGSKAGLVPLHIWLPPAHAAAPSHVSALMSGVMTKVALYVLIRILFDLCGPAQPVLFGLPLVVLGAAGAVLGALRANVETDIKAILACSTIENIGLIAAGLGLALVARGADLPALASLAAAAALLHAMAHGVFKPLLFLGAGAVQHSAGTRRMDLLGGLSLRMPLTTACMVFGAANLAALPPSAGFAGEWLLFQSMLSGPRIGGLGLQITLCIAAGLMALGAALAAAAAIRLIGVGFLGRPRGPRAAAAEEASPWERRAMLFLTATCLLIGLFPGGMLRLASPALLRLSGSDLADRAGLLLLSPGRDLPGYPALAALFLIALAWAGIRFLRTRAEPGIRRGPAWDCGFGADSARLPFGDPLSQYSAEGFGQPLRRALGTALLTAREQVDMPEPGDNRPARLSADWQDPATARLFLPFARLRDRISGIADAMQFLTIRRILSVMVTVLIALLAALAWLEQA